MRILIVSHNRPRLLRRTLQSIVECERPANYIETIVVENGGRFGAAEVVEEFANVLNARYQFVPSSAKTVALNAGLQPIRDGLVVFFDDDVRLEKQTLMAYHDAAGHSMPQQYYGGPTSIDYDVPPPKWVLPFLPPSASGMEFTDETVGVRPPHYFLGFNWAARAEDIKRCGGFDESFGPGTLVAGGDENFMQEALFASGICGRYVPEARVWHYVPKGRCTPQWCLSRARSGGFNSGIRARLYAQERKHHFAFIRSFYKGAQRQASRIRLTPSAVARPEGRLWCCYTLVWLKEFSRGYFSSRKTSIDASTVDLRRD